MHQKVEIFGLLEYTFKIWILTRILNLNCVRFETRLHATVNVEEIDVEDMTKDGRNSKDTEEKKLKVSQL